MLESRLPKTGDEDVFQVAVTGQKIIRSSIDEIKLALKYAMVKVGLRGANWPNEDETRLLLQHIILHYGTHTVDEIRLAFDMAIIGRLDVDPNCFENFSCMYLSGILNAYRKWAVKTAAFIEKKAVELLPAPAMTAEQKLEIDCEYIYAKNKVLGKRLLPPLKFRF